MKCPQCNKVLPELTRTCNFCKADLDLLVEYVHNLQGGLERAQRLTRVGELGQAFWEYLAVLEVDPDNPTARRQVGQVVTAVRQFDRTATELAAPAAELGEWFTNLSPMLLLEVALCLLLMLAAFSLGHYLGNPTGPGGNAAPSPPGNNQLMGN